MAKSSTKTGIASSLDFLAQPEKYPAANFCAVFGDDAFLKAEVVATLRRQVLKGEEADFGLTVFIGRETQLRDVRDALSSQSLFGDGARLVIIEEADTFVTEYRAELEELVTAARGVLVLEVKTWPGNTRLAKAVDANGLAIDCRSYESLQPKDQKPREREVKKWLAERATTVYQVRIDPAAIDALGELVPPEPGILVQEIARLALLTGADRVIDTQLVRDNVGGWRTRATWDMVDATADGRAADALLQLDRLITSGEKPQGLLPQMASTLRRFASAIELFEAAEADGRRLPSREALSQAGVLPFKLNDAERQLRQIGRRRAKQLTQWLLAADLAIKSHNSADDRARTELERIIVQLSKNATAVSA